MFSACYSLTSARIIVMDVSNILPICLNISFGELFTVIKKERINGCHKHFERQL